MSQLASQPSCRACLGTSAEGERARQIPRLVHVTS